MQRDDEAPREISKSFTTSRAELTLQPERSGHYVFTFIAISDANYRKVELQGPSIDQMIHPLASADFSESHGSGRGKRIVNTCSGDTVDIDVDLKVSPDVHSTRLLLTFLSGYRTMEFGTPGHWPSHGRDYAIASNPNIEEDHSSPYTSRTAEGRWNI